MTSFPLRLMRRIGLKPRTPYEHLKTSPRFEEKTVELLGKPFRLADGSSFYASYKEIFLDEIYKFDCETNSPIILDCGSNYGLSVIYFKMIYPYAKIIAVEADPEIFALLKLNVEQRGLKDVTLINKAIAVDEGSITFYKEGSTGSRITPIAGNTNTVMIETVRIDDLIGDHVDFLKMDIEGAENEVIPASEKLHLAQQLFVEYHGMANSAQTLSSILDVISKNNFRYYIHTEFCSPRPLTEERLNLGMDLQLNIFAKKCSQSE